MKIDGGPSVRTLVAAPVAKLSLWWFTRGLRKKRAQPKAAEDTHLFRPLRHELDPLDKEILERVLDATFAAVQGDEGLVDFDSDEGLEAVLRRELIEIACFTGVSDPETLKDLLLARLPVRPAPTAGKASREGELRSNDLLLFVADATGTKPEK